MIEIRWANAVRALRCLAADPAGLGGLHLRARAGDARDAWLARARDAFPNAARLHPEIGDAELFGGLDLTETLRTGHPVRRDGLLARHSMLLLPMAERATPGLGARLGQVLDAGEHAVIALDEGAEPEEGIPASLADRLGLSVDLDGLRAGDMPDDPGFAAGEPVDPDDVTPRLVAVAAALGIPSARTAQFAVRLARASARIDGREDVCEGDLAFAVALGLVPRARQIPSAEEPVEPAESPEAEPDTSESPPEEGEDLTLPDGDILLEAALALLPPDLLARLANGSAARAAGAGAGAVRKGNRRGRPLPSRAGRLDGRARIDLVATLRAAAPWQMLRGGGPGRPVQVRSTDIRLKRYESRSDRLVIFAVDASGSAAFARLGEVKGAVELLLAEAYARRDHVALVSFRGERADLLLPPTRSLVRTKRELAGLPGGGGTPLAAGLREALELAIQARGRGMDPGFVVLTDGRPNVALSGHASRSEAIADAEAVASLLRAARIGGLVIDTGRRPSAALADLAARMDAPYLPLPRADARDLSRAVVQAL